MFDFNFYIYYHTFTLFLMTEHKVVKQPVICCHTSVIDNVLTKHEKNLGSVNIPVRSPRLDTPRLGFIF